MIDFFLKKGVADPKQRRCDRVHEWCTSICGNPLFGPSANLDRASRTQIHGVDVVRLGTPKRDEFRFLFKVGPPGGTGPAGKKITHGIVPSPRC